jgi:hypothetical protein
VSDIERFALGRVKWWRETILKGQLGGQARRAGFGGPWMFTNDAHQAPGLWPPSEQAVKEANDSSEWVESLKKSRPTPVEAP